MLGFKQSRAKWMLLQVAVVMLSLQVQAQETVELTPERIGELSHGAVNGANEVSLRVPDQEVARLHQKAQAQIQSAEADWTKLSVAEQARIAELRTPVEANYSWLRRHVYNPTARRDFRTNHYNNYDAGQIEERLQEEARANEAKMSKLRAQIPLVTADEVANVEKVLLPADVKKATAILKRYARMGSRLVQVAKGGVIAAGIYLIFESTLLPSEAMAETVDSDLQMMESQVEASLD